MGAGSPSARITCEAVPLKLAKWDNAWGLPDKGGGGGKKEEVEAHCLCPCLGGNCCSTLSSRTQKEARRPAIVEGRLLTGGGAEATGPSSST